MQSMKKNDPITARQAADRLGVSVFTVYRWLDAGTLRGYRAPTGSVRIDPASVEAILAASSQKMGAGSNS